MKCPAKWLITSGRRKYVEKTWTGWFFQRKSLARSTVMSYAK
jgi:hypothetical protein